MQELRGRCNGRHPHLTFDQCVEEERILTRLSSGTVITYCRYGTHHDFTNWSSAPLKNAHFIVLVGCTVDTVTPLTA